MKPLILTLSIQHVQNRVLMHHSILDQLWVLLLRQFFLRYHIKFLSQVLNYVGLSFEEGNCPLLSFDI